MWIKTLPNTSINALAELMLNQKYFYKSKVNYKLKISA